MIKGRYVCQVEVDFQYDNQEKKIMYKELRDRLYGEWINTAISEAVEEVFYGGNPRIIVTRMLGDVKNE